jgi:hypothetical protein
MIRIFKRRRPEPAPETVTTQADILTAHAWGFTLTEWHAEPDEYRAWFRRHVSQAPKFGVGA